MILDSAQHVVHHKAKVFAMLKEDLKAGFTRMGLNFSSRPRLQLLLFIALLAFAIVSKLIRLEVPAQHYFDEVYHGYTAQEYVKGNKETYDPFAKPPEGFANEWTHPPLGKMLTAVPMALFGDNFFTMRLSSFFFGVVCIVLTYMLAFLLFQSFRVAILASFLLSIEGLSFAQSRIAMIDSHLTAFCLLSAIAFVWWRENKKKPTLLLTGFFLGLAASTKWSAIYYMFLLTGFFLWEWKDLLFKKPKKLKKRDDPFLKEDAIIYFVWGFFCIGVVPGIVYLASYLHYFSFGYKWPEFIELQRQMWYYHTALKATHGYQSVPYQWLLNLRPVWFFVNYISETRIANIYNLGNSVILYYGLLAAGFLMAQFKWIEEKTERWIVIFLIASWAIFWLPWCFSPRIMFFYHYTPSIPFLVIFSAYVLNKGFQHQAQFVRISSRVVVGLAVAWFIFFYPQLTALSVSKDFANAAYYWIPSWR